MSVQILHGDCRCVVTSPLGRAPDLVQTFGGCEVCLHRFGQFGRARGSAGVSAPDCDPSYLAGFFDVTQRKAVQSLFALDAKVGQKGAQAGDCPQIGCLPRKERTPARSGWFVDPKAASKRVAQQRRHFRSDMLQHHPLAEDCGARVSANAHRIGRSLHADAAIAVHRASQVRIKKVIAHGH